jgi:flagellar basal body-associated protein FliL
MTHKKEITMKNHMRFVLSLAIVITCAMLGLAQNAATTQQRIFTHNGRIETSYDQVKEITTVQLSPMQVYGEPLASSDYIGGDQARFNASFTYSGRTLRAQPKRVLFSLISTSEDWKYTDFHKLTALVDGKRLQLGPLEHVPSFTVNAPANTNSDDYISQAIAISLPYKTFLRIANGKKVQIRMGPREFKLEKNHLEALRDLATWMVP